ncbi:hypothetical protein GE09DRAFT_1227757 [Coniochaeta sp. 2T2.1]|nr:hypothetical protein GE09DRAFT_1227757 [Coniochaeta sp. 2T2.1]
MKDLLTLDLSPSAVDPFTNWITNYAIDTYHNIIGRRVYKKDAEKQTTLENSVVYTAKGIQRLTRSFTIMLACMIPIASTLILYYVRSNGQRLGIIAGFTAFFSATLGLATTATMQEIFSATAAYVAVSIVWVGSAGSNSTSNS